MKVNVLGTEYEIIKGTEEQFKELKDAHGHCSFFDKKIYYYDLLKDDGWKDSDETIIQARTKNILLHELTHAFLFESGLYGSCNIIEGSWSLNEEIVDWMAIQMPKIMKAYDSVLNVEKIDISFPDGRKDTIELSK